MDEEKASGLVIRTSVDTADKQSVCHIFTSSHSYILCSWKAIFSKGLVRPIKLFIYEPIVQLLGLYMAFVYGLLYCMHHNLLSCMPSYKFFIIYNHDPFDLPRCLS